MGDIEGLYPFERDIYYTMLREHIEEVEEKRKQAKNA